MQEQTIVKNVTSDKQKLINFPRDKPQQVFR